ncbi:outer membrane protein [Rhodoblastus acidophilus]|uniref:OmpW/AlkL family protein n=1 Tax=Rhodoblastus acidophilus TaxID=1074 RepID=UPI0022246CF7|nr:OmpW family outer membrane protein [Rhodoblastus acidophilus]MCW2284457.1 outer membrane protein [Rhodoblastus acidophilus]MCW2333304.1 outer membrane protein [Rhodoblastus acidophilus]
MKFNLLKALGTTALLCAFAASAQAADLPSDKATLTPPPAVETFQPMFLKLGFTYAINQSSSHLYEYVPVLGRSVDTGWNASISNIATVGFEAGLFLTKNISVNVSGGLPLSANDSIKGAPYPYNGLVLTKLYPGIVPVTVVWHFDNFGAFQPYIGVGLAPGFSFSNKDALLTNVKVSGSVNTIVQFGADYMLTPRWGISLDVKKAFSYVTGHGYLASVYPGAQISVDQHAHFNPWLLSTGIVYRFGGSDSGPVLAKY